MTIAQQKKTSVSLPFYSPIGDEQVVFKTAWQAQLPILLKGPTGCGKTRFVEHMAASLKLPLFTVACHDDLTAADLIGRHLIKGGDTYWQDGPLTRAVREGGICYLDEVVEARKDTTVVIHPLTDNRRILPVERTGETLHAPASFMLVVSYNPGYQHLFKGLKPSTRQRFLAIDFAYPEVQQEVLIIQREAGVSESQAQILVAIGQSFRALADVDLEEPVSTRLLIYAGKLLAHGLDTKTACRHALIETLSDELHTQLALSDVINAVVDEQTACPD